LGLEPVSLVNKNGRRFGHVECQDDTE